MRCLACTIFLASTVRGPSASGESNVRHYGTRETLSSWKTCRLAFATSVARVISTPQYSAALPRSDVAQFQRNEPSKSLLIIMRQPESLCASLTSHSWTPELRAEREALSLLHFLRDQVQPQSEWLAALSADQTLSDPVRQRALQFAREWKP